MGTKPQFKLAYRTQICLLIVSINVKTHLKGILGLLLGFQDIDKITGTLSWERGVRSCLKKKRRNPLFPKLRTPQLLFQLFLIWKPKIKVQLSSDMSVQKHHV